MQPTVVPPLVPPFTIETATQKVKRAEDAWNSRDPERVALAYTEDSAWRNRDEVFQGRDAIRAFLRRKWAKELDYKLMKEMWCFHDNRISVRFEYEWHDLAGQWYRSHGNEHWEFDERGLMRRRDASINDLAIDEASRRHRRTSPGVEEAAVLGQQKLVAFVATRDAARATDFYQRVLGLSLVSSDAYAVVFDANGTMLRVQKVDDLAAHPFTSLGWQVLDIDAVVAKLAREQVTMTRYPGLVQEASGIWTAPSGARVAWFQDPDGNVLSLTQF